ncbi:non-hydrolyzing UDP-N-acetylglucosamine 2-epimerase [uncultured Desulfosarcina sp.]|uniref:non-hydrolyzing UDP-N-acetylglucosamine 2-epimerase n=1 Tax=uncultured Desulfosarcina sp. TaxID=218289 RepID=UPI0029C84455|nr:UDP-N-acetylglucosamine 2-epimerase (non-hydrolyzing) [uncultured Desulfosarcina sp.]
MQIHLIAAARPNFMKIAPLYHALKAVDWADPVIVHTGQHYDLNMSDAFFTDLKLPAPHIHLGVGSGSHAEQTGNVMMAYEKVILEKKPDLVVVVGDVNSTLACTLAAVKVSYPIQNSKFKIQNLRRPLVAHLEAGLRSFDRTMPEEINRIATDALADVLWTPSSDGDENLVKEGVDPEKIERVGNIMIDSLEMMRETITAQNAHVEFGLEKGLFGVVTFHRPANVDNVESLTALCSSLISISKRLPLVFPVHPRTRKNLQECGLISKLDNCSTIILTEPLNYVRFMSLIFNCRMVITDSGGIQEETTYLGIPCLTMRPNTERPVTVTEGTNCLCALDEIEGMVLEALQIGRGTSKTPDLWDGHTAQRVVKSIKRFKETIVSTGSLSAISNDP